MTIDLARRTLIQRIVRAPRVFVRMFRIVHGMPLADRLRFAAWQTWQSVRHF